MEPVGLTEKLRRGDVFAEKCPSREILNHLTSRWGVLALMALLDGTRRFSELRRKVGGVSEKMLAQTLKRLEKDGFVLRTAYDVVPPRVEYALTPLGREAAGHVAALADWIETHLPQILPDRPGVRPDRPDVQPDRPDRPDRPGGGAGEGRGS